METKKRITPVVPAESNYFYEHKNGALWSLGFKDSAGEERYLLPCYFERENNRGWTFRLAHAMASTQLKVFLARGEWELVE